MFKLSYRFVMLMYSCTERRGWFNSSCSCPRKERAAVSGIKYVNYGIYCWKFQHLTGFTFLGTDLWQTTMFQWILLGLWSLILVPMSRWNNRYKRQLTKSFYKICFYIFSDLQLKVIKKIGNVLNISDLINRF